MAEMLTVEYFNFYKSELLVSIKPSSIVLKIKVDFSLKYLKYNNEMLLPVPPFLESH